MQMQSQSNRSSPRLARTEPLPEPLAEQLEAAASRHGFGFEAAKALWRAVVLGRGAMAQFDHAEFGGSGQWMHGGMLMIGDMFNSALKARVGALCEDIARLYGGHPEWHLDRVPRRAGTKTEWWPAGLHSPSSSGAQNGIRYAYFPAQRRLAIERGDAVELYDTEDHLIGAVSQQQGGADSLVFASQHGDLDLGELRRLDAAADGRAAKAADTVQPLGRGAAAPPSMPRAVGAGHDVLDIIEKLAALHARGVLTDAEFGAKKTELLGRL